MNSFIKSWLLTDVNIDKHTTDSKKYPWWKVACLTGVDYFSTLGYQPGIAVLAAGSVAPLATLLLVLVTLFGAVPVYRKVAKESPDGEGSISMLERLLSWWSGKILILILLGFVVTDFIITITMSASDAAAHLAHSTFTPVFWLNHNVLLTILMVFTLGLIFLRGFTEAINLAVMLVIAYLTLNMIVIVVCLKHLVNGESYGINWNDIFHPNHTSMILAFLIAAQAFPRLALGISGFETGVLVMSQIKSSRGNEITESNIQDRITGAHKLLLTVALIMSVFLLTSSLVVSSLVQQSDLTVGGVAEGRALSFLAYKYLGADFGNLYDISTILILWFAGASAMAGLLNLVPKYLPRYGMAPEWLKYIRPFVIIITLISISVIWYFKADINSQAGVYATGVLVLITSACMAVTISIYRKKAVATFLYFVLVSLIFIYTTLANIIERPDGVKIASLFIVAIVVISFISRLKRAFELRVSKVVLDKTAQDLVMKAAANGLLTIIAHDTDKISIEDYDIKELQERTSAGIPEWDSVLFLEINVTDSSEFSTEVLVRGKQAGRHQILWADSPVIANAIAAILLELRNQTAVVPDIYIDWTEGSLFKNYIKFLWIGEGEVATATMEVLRRAEKNKTLRPRVHVS